MTTKNPAAVALGALGNVKGGQSTSPAKQAASRLNGRKGGRPRRYCGPCDAYTRSGCRARRNALRYVQCFSRMKRTMPTKQIVVREIPVDLWKQLKIRAVQDNQSLQAALVKAIESYLQPAA